MNKSQRKELYKKAWNKWGFEKQMGMLMEECAELIQAANKYVRLQKNPDYVELNRSRLAEEIADVEIMIEQIEMVRDWECLRKHINEAKAEKLKRLIEVLG